MQNVLDFCSSHGLDLSHEQQVMVKTAVAKGQFIGIARGYGTARCFPAIELRGRINVIDAAGYHQLAPPACTLISYYNAPGTCPARGEFGRGPEQD